MFKTIQLKKLRVLGLFVLSIGTYLALEQWIDLRTKGFCLQKILSSDIPYRSEWEAPSLLDGGEVDAILDQPFHLIGAGSECFAFASQDGKFVMKCFKLSFARPVYYNKGLLAEDYSHYAGLFSNHPLLKKKWPDFLEKCKLKIFGIREFRIARTFLSSLLAYQHLKEETGLVYLHLNPTSSFHKNLTLIDGSGIAHQIPVDATRFLLQKKATPLETHLKNLIKQNKKEELQQSIDSVFDLILNRCKKGFSDRDFINRNVGFVDNHAIEIDIGSFAPDPTMKDPLVYRKEIVFSTLDLRKWLKKNAPDTLDYFDEKIDRCRHH